MPSRDVWWEDMACRGVDPRIFERPVGRPSTDHAWANEALSYCRRCPVRLRCLEEHLRVTAADGAATERHAFHSQQVIGALLPHEVAQLRRERSA